MVHPWETGCDDSPVGIITARAPASISTCGVDTRSICFRPFEFGPTGGPLANPAFGAASVSFNALTVWNARELASVTGDDELLADVDALVPLIEDRWDADLATWVDAGPRASTSRRIRTATRCALLVVDDTDQRAAAVASLADSADHGGAFGPTAFTRPSRCTTRRPTGGGRCGPAGLPALEGPRSRTGRDGGRGGIAGTNDRRSSALRVRRVLGRRFGRRGGRSRSPGPDSHSCWRRPARPRPRLRGRGCASPHAARRSSPRLPPPRATRRPQDSQARSAGRTAADAAPEVGENVGDTDEDDEIAE